MADISDVLNALASTLATAFYPHGTGQPSATGLPMLVYPGWPAGSQLDTDMAALSASTGGRIHVSLFPKTEKNTTRWMRSPVIPSINPATLTATISGRVVTIGGTVSTPQNVAVVANGTPYLHAVQAGDTLGSIAAALGAQIEGATVIGSAITLPDTFTTIEAATGAAGTLSAPMRNTQRVIQMTVWANTPGNRDICGKALDNALAGVDFITLPDGTAARLIYVSSPYDDITQKANVYRRDVLYTADFMTTQAFDAAQVVAAGLQLGVQMPDGTVRPISTTYQ
jgi:hypothetical protein